MILRGVTVPRATGMQGSRCTQLSTWMEGGNGSAWNWQQGFRMYHMQTDACKEIAEQIPIHIAPKVYLFDCPILILLIAAQ